MFDGQWSMVNGKEEGAMGKIERVEQMPVYQLCFRLALEVEKMTRNFGPDFRWLRIQSLRSSESVCANMTEGFYAQYSTEYLQALYRCRREARETMAHLHYAVGVQQLKESVITPLLDQYEEATIQLGNLMTSIERKIQEYGKSKSSSFQIRESAGEYDIDLYEPSIVNCQPSTIDH
jgi:four helix bundle protein